MVIIMTLWIGHGAVLTRSYQWQLKEDMNYLFSKFFLLPLIGTFKNCTITYP